MVTVTRKRGESFDAMARRFRTHITRRRLIQEVREKRFLIPEKSRNMQRASKLTRIKMGKKFEYLKKIGALPPQEPTYKRS